MWTFIKPDGVVGMNLLFLTVLLNYVLVLCKLCYRRCVYSCEVFTLQARAELSGVA